ncbi:type II secretion system F family protein [Nonomuraea sp. NPDC004354]
MTLTAALCGALALWLWTGPTRAHRRLSRLLGVRPPSPGPSSLWARVHRPSAARRAEAWHVASIELCQALSAELAAGRTAGEALTRALAAVDFPDPLNPLAAAARDGGDVAAAFREVAPTQGGEGLRRLAACWEVSVSVGAGLSGPVDRVGTSLRAAQAHRGEVSAQLAGPRATARMLAALPVLGLLMGAALGMNPLGFLLGSVPGLGCLTVGVALDACGLWWTQRMASRAESA